MERHNIHAEHGFNRGKFVTRKRKQWRDNVLAAKRTKLSEQSPSSDIGGRRVVELGYLAEELWCNQCNIPLSLRNVEAELIMGLASLLDVRCIECNVIKKVSTGKRKHSDKQRNLHDVNFQLAIGVIDAGIGEAQVNTLLSALDIHPVNKGLLKRHERYAGLAIERVAKESCRTSIELERNLTIEAEMTMVDNCQNAQPTANTNSSAGELKEISGEFEVNSSDQSEQRSVPLKASYDAGWQKRGTGHSYNSLTGHASLIGYYSGLVLSYATRTKKCAMCEYGHEKSDHDCRLNFDRSAKAMEPDMAVELITKNELLKEAMVTIEVLIADDDASSIAAVRREASHRVDKWSDVNHAKKGLTSALYAMNLPKGLIDYFGRAFSRAIHQNKDDESETKSALQNVVDHAYGNHDRCGSWCRSHTDENYIHKGLPDGKPLTDPELRVKLASIFAKYANNASKLAPCGSSQANENFNRIVCSKHPKTQFYGASESMAFRVAAAVCQKNLGTQYTSRVCENLALSPGKETMKFREKKDEVRSKKSEKSKTIDCKRRRLFVAKKRCAKNSTSQRREGITYQSNCGLDGVSELLWDKPDQDVPLDWAESKIVLFDLETSGLSQSAEICQISAATENETFNVYMVPKSMTPGAAATTGLQVRAGEMFLNDKQLDTVPPRVGLLSFINFLRNNGVNNVLVAHNGFRFDSPMILRAMRQFELLTDFIAVVKGFADTLSIFRDRLVERKEAKKKFSQAALALDFLGPSAIEGAHNAQNDIRVLRLLIDATGIDDETIRAATKTTRDILRDQEKLNVEQTIKAGLQCLRPGVSVGMIAKMAKTGISMDVLEKSYRDGGENAVTMLLGEDIGGRPRVSKAPRVIKGVVGMLVRQITAE